MEPELKPLMQFYCDTCGEIIPTVGDACLIWKSTRTGYGRFHNHSPRIVHRIPSSPSSATNSQGCSYEEPYSDMDLKHLVGQHGLTELLAFLDAGPVCDPKNEMGPTMDIRPWVELVRRLHTPYYEEARRYFDQAAADGLFEGANQTSPYSNLKDLIQKYRRT